jgi:hypothetical protein
MRFFSYSDPEQNTREQINKVKAHDGRQYSKATCQGGTRVTLKVKELTIESINGAFGAKTPVQASQPLSLLLNLASFFSYPVAAGAEFYHLGGKS